MKKQKAFTLLELAIVVIILGILVSYGVPRFQRAIEESKVDLAVANLESIWTAQRLYKAQDQNSEFAIQLSALNNFLDSSFMTSATDSNAKFIYSTSTGTTAGEFWAKATRQNSTYWSGYIVIDTSGTLSGYIQDTHGNRVLPSKQ